MFKTPTAAALALLLAACGAAQPRRSPSQGAPPPPATAREPVAGASYRIDPQESELRILVYRAGVMAALGHNHVIVNRSLKGSVSTAGAISGTSFSLSVPTAGFIVDDAQARHEEGADFTEDTPDDAKSGTLHNMLGPALLDAANYPAITLRSVAVAESDGAAMATVILSIAGSEQSLAVPFTVENSSGRLSASGAMTVRQTAIGLTPFSLFLGALRVQDEMRIKFKLIARAD